LGAFDVVQASKSNFQGNSQHRQVDEHGMMVAMIETEKPVAGALDLFSRG
jgi:hypothetical protein